MRPDPAHFAAGPYDPEPLIKLSVLCCFVEFSKHVSTVVGVDDFFIRRGILHQRLARTPGDGLIGLVDVKSLLALGIDHPEDFLDIAGHLLEFMRCRFEDAGRVALVTPQLEQHFSQKKAEKTKSRCHGDQEHQRHPWSLKVRDQYGNEEDD